MKISITERSVRLMLSTDKPLLLLGFIRDGQNNYVSPNITDVNNPLSIQTTNKLYKIIRKVLRWALIY
jgi:hypothetical protein